MNRNVVNLPKNIKCAICEKEISLYGMYGHIIFTHKIKNEEYILKYGEYKLPKPNKTNRKIKKITCGICNKVYSSVGIHVHLRDTHNMTDNEYCNKYGEYRPSKLKLQEYSDRLIITSDENKQTCLICNNQFASGHLLQGHLKREHTMLKKDYIIKYIFNNIVPLCKCGCQNPVKLLTYVPYKTDYISGHNDNPMIGKCHTIESKLKMSDKAVDRMHHNNKKTNTLPETKFKSILDKFSISYAHPYISS